MYSPCLKESITYDRAVGYFRANIYRELGEDLLDFVINGGKVRLVTSPDIPESDENAAREGYALRSKREKSEKDTSLIRIMKIMSDNPKESDCLDMLRILIEKDCLDLYIALREGGIYHRKIGFFRDEFSNKVVFSGSGNETSMAIGYLEDWGNDEDFDVFRSWGSEFERRKAEVKEQHLRTLFSGGSQRTKVRPINEIERSYLNNFRSHADFEDCRKGARMRSGYLGLWKNNGKISLYAYQRAAVEAWKKSGNIGMLSMATGTGKTFTALFAIEELLNKGNPTLILVPSKILLEQWKTAINKIYSDIPVLVAGGGHSWKKTKNKRMFISNIELPRIILATMDTAVTSDFFDFFNQTQNPVLVADEAHRLGSKGRRRILDIDFVARLGLSATPERLFDKEGSKILERSFGEIPVFCLDIGDSVQLTQDDSKKIPILGHFLSKYDYYYYTIKLTPREQKEWDKITNEIRKQVAINYSGDSEGFLELNSRLNLLLIERSRIIKKAANKVKIVSKILEEKYSPSDKWIIYCEDENQLDLVVNEISTKNHDLVILKYHSKMSVESRSGSLDYFKNNPSVIVSIRCLDEGVDIPSANGAIILASSSNPRQYIQRRGRVLRKIDRKKSASIIDVIALPAVEYKEVPFSIVRGELGRAWNFAKNARNRDVTHELWKLCMEYGVNFEADPHIGIED